MKIHHAGSRPSETGSPEYFLGDVRLDPVISTPDPSRVRIVTVTFEPGSRTAWHTHPLGQTLIVTAGKGLAQTEGGPLESILPGDVVWFPPGERHWHGAAADVGMTHIAVQEAIDGVNVAWEEQVTEAQYSGES